MSRFDECMQIIDSPEVEGGFSNHKHDKGGATMRGVTQEVFDRWLAGAGQASRPVSTITDFEVSAVYREFWNGAQCDDMPEPLDLLIFDVALNSGPAKAIVLLQRALGLPLKYQTGYFGPITRGSLAKALADGGVMTVCDNYLDQRVTFYHNRVRLDPTQASFINGWLNRVQLMARAIGLDERKTA